MNDAQNWRRPNVVGMHARKVAELAGLNVPANTKMLVAELPGVGAEYPMSKRKIISSIGYDEIRQYRAWYPTVQSKCLVRWLGSLVHCILAAMT